MKSLSKIFENLLKNKDLDFKTSTFLFTLIFDEKIDQVQIASLLTLFKTKGECFEEIYAAVYLLRQRAKKIEISQGLIDTCGTGGDNKNSFNISTATAILCSACGLKVAKHGNKSVTSMSGSSDILQSLEINIKLNEKDQKKYFKKNNICFLFAPLYHESLKKVATIRKYLPFKTIFNLIGPLLNPTKIDYQLLGVSNKNNLDTHSKCLSKLNQKESWVVFNMNGYDELTTTSPNLIRKVIGNKITRNMSITPEDVGLPYSNEEDLRGGSPEENAYIMQRLFEGETGPIRDNVLLNTAACLVMTKKVNNLREGVFLASKNIDNFSAKNKLESLKNISNE